MGKEQPRRYALIWCSREARANYRQEMVDAFRVEGDRWDVIEAYPGLDAALEGYDGYVISGSEFSVNDHEPWIIRLLRFITEVAESGRPLLGICFGCQAIARALGGEVGFNPGGSFRFGADVVEPLGPLRDWFQQRHLPEPRLIESHGECVTRLPPGARRLGRSESTEVEVFGVGSRVLGIQGHPELSRETVLSAFLPIHLESGTLTAAEAERARAELALPLIHEGMRALCREHLAGARRPEASGVLI